MDVAHGFFLSKANAHAAREVRHRLPLASPPNLSLGLEECHLPTIGVSKVQNQLGVNGENDLRGQQRSAATQIDHLPGIVFLFEPENDVEMRRHSQSLPIPPPSADVARRETPRQGSASVAVLGH